MEHDEFIYREEDEEPSRVQELIDSGYLSTEDSGCKYFYSPEHWVLIQDDGPHDYLFDNVAFRALTDKARDLARSEGF